MAFQPTNFSILAIYEQRAAAFAVKDGAHVGEDGKEVILPWQMGEVD